jgi:uncharacterized protein
VTAVPIWTNYDFFVPAFEVRVKGRGLPGDAVGDVLSVSYSDSLDKLDSCQITLTNWDEERRDFKYTGDPARAPVDFRLGTDVELWMGYRDRGGLTLMLRGEVVSVAPDFPAGGQPTVQVRILNKLYKLHFKQETRAFQDRTDSQIADQIVQKLAQDLSARASAAGSPPLNLTLQTSPQNTSIERPHAYILLRGEYPIVFLMERARHNGYDLYVEEDPDTRETKLHFHPPDRGMPAAYELVWGESLISFKPTLRTKEQVSTVVVRGWDPVKKEAFEGKATLDDLDRGLLETAELAAADSALAGSEVVITDEFVQDKQEAEQKALGHLRDGVKDLVTGSGTTVGLPELRAGQPAHIGKLGPVFSGRYLVTSSTHAIGDGGYTTQFEARMEQPDDAGGNP